MSELDVRPGGQLRYMMTATAPEQIAFMRSVGAPLTTEVRKTFTEVVPATRLGYLVHIQPAGGRTNVVMTLDPLHDDTWTQQHRAHRGNELDHLEAAIKRRGM